MDRKRTGRRLLLLLAAALGLGLVLLGVLGRRATPGHVARQEARNGESARMRAALERIAQARTAVPAATAAAQGPIIDEVVLEKGEVCDGEENLVTVKAHTPGNADDAFLHGLVDGRPGSTVVLRATVERSGSTDVPVVVFGRNGTSTTAHVPPFRVKDCKVPWKLLLWFRLLPNRAAAFELSARIDRYGASRPFVANRYLWSFGDGTGSETTQSIETHDFSRRPQQAMVSTFVVTCVAVAGSGEKVTGRVTLQLNNLAFETFAQKGVVLVSAEPDPLFPTLNEDGQVLQRIRLWHAYDHPVRIERLRRSALVLGRPGGAAQDVPLSLLGVDSIGSGETAQSKDLVLDTKAEPDVYSAEYWIEGKTEDGWPARGNFALMRPPTLPSPQRSRPVNDPALKAKIVRARALLGKEYVTDEDIWRLERAGALSR